jgi:MFS family permease
MDGARLVLAIACAAHVVHDGFSDVLYVLLPVWAGELALTLTQAGAIRSIYSAGMALSQLPAGFMAERWGERRLLAAGTAVTAASFLLAATGATGFAVLTSILFVAGLGSGVQHPLASSLVSKAYEIGRRRAALGTYNFAGDLGKIAAPAAVGLAAAAVGWRTASGALAVLGLGAGAVILAALAEPGGAREAPGEARDGSRDAVWGIRDARGFRSLTAIGIIDTATRAAFVTFLPFTLAAKGLTVAGVGAALAVLFAGGAAGKFACGLVAERVGVIRTVMLTELATALGIATVVVAPLPVTLAALVPIGVALNGTSSVLYGTVADLVDPARRARAYGLYYTLIVGASAIAPIAYGVVGDGLGVPAALLVTAGTVLVTVPLSVGLRPAVAGAAALRSGSLSPNDSR